MLRPLLIAVCLALGTAALLRAAEGGGMPSAKEYTGTFVKSDTADPAFKVGETTYYLKVAKSADEASKGIAEKKQPEGSYVIEGITTKDDKGKDWLVAYTIKKKE